MSNLTDSRIESAKNVSKDHLIDKIRSNNSILFDQMLIESEERKTYYFVKYKASSLSRIPYLLKFPLFKDLLKDFEDNVNKTGDIQFLNNKNLIDRIKSKGKQPTQNSKYTGKILVFNELPLVSNLSEINFNQPLYYIPLDTERYICNTCKGDKYTKCTEPECRGQHIYECNECRSIGKVDCPDCNARGEYTCPSCHGRGRLRCTECDGSGIDKKSDSRNAKCKSCNGTGERKCSSLSGHGLMGAVVKKAAGNEYCGGSGIIKCSTCNASGKITCKKCNGNGKLECKTCYGDHIDDRYGKVDCANCETAGELASISYIESNITEHNLETIITNGTVIEAPGFDIHTIKKHMNQSISLEETFIDINELKKENYNTHSSFSSKTLLTTLGLFKDRYPRILKEEIFYEGIPCVTFKYNHILSATVHYVSIISIDNANEVIFHSNPTVVENKVSITDKIREWLNQAFSTKAFIDKIDRKHEFLLMIYMAKADGIIEDSEKMFLSKSITGLQGFTSNEKKELFDLMSLETMPPINPMKSYFSSLTRADEAISKIAELVAKADGSYNQPEIEKLEEIKKAIEQGIKNKPSFFGRFFKTVQVSIPILAFILIIITFGIYSLFFQSKMVIEPLLINDTIQSSSKMIVEEAPKIEAVVETKQQKEVPSDLAVKIFFIDQSGTEEDRLQFQYKKSYTFCYDSETFSKITIEGSDKNISMIIKRDDVEIFKLDNIEVINMKDFTASDFNIEMGYTYQVLLMKNNHVIFDGKIDSNGCM